MVYHLNSLENPLLFSCLNKLSNDQLCKMRCTCSSLNNFIEEHRKILASRPKIGTTIFLRAREGMEITAQMMRRKAFVINEIDVEETFSAISCKDLLVEISDSANPEVYKKFLNVLERLNLQSEHATIKIKTETYEKCECVLKMMEATNTKGRCLSYNVHAHGTAALRKLAMKAANLHKRSNCTVTYNKLDEVIPCDVAENIRCFRCVFWTCEKEDFHSFLWALHYSQDIGRLESIYHTFQENENIFDSSSPLVAHDVLWDLSSIPNESRWIHRRNYIPDLPSYPSSVRKMNFGSKCAVMIEADNRVYMHFMDNSNSSALRSLLIGYLDLGHVSHMLDHEFLTATTERQAEMLREAYYSADIPLCITSYPFIVSAQNI